MPASYPATSDVQAYATAQGVTVDATQCAAALAGVIAEWERRTRFVPFLGESSDSVDYFDANGSTLWLPGYVSITSVFYGITATESGGSVSYTAGTRSYKDVGHYERKEWDRVLSPITWINWITCVPAGVRSVKVTGKRGCLAAVPDDVWRGLVQRAGDRSIQEKQPGLLRGIAEIDVGRGDQRVKYGSVGAASAAYEAAFNVLVAQYRRATL